MKTTSTEMFAAFLALYPQHEEELRERASIMEYHGGMTRGRAEAMAVARLMDKYGLWNEIGRKTA